MGARGETLVPLLVAVAAAAALQSTYLQVEPVDPQKPGELLRGTAVGLGTVTGRWGREGEVSLILLSLPPRTAGTRPIVRYGAQNVFPAWWACVGGALRVFLSFAPGSRTQLCLIVTHPLPAVGVLGACAR